MPDQMKELIMQNITDKGPGNEVVVYLFKILAHTNTSHTRVNGRNIVHLSENMFLQFYFADISLVHI